MFGFIKKIFKKVDTFREDLEDCFANILEKIDSNTKIDELEAKLIKNGIKLAISRYGINIPDTAYDYISKSIVDTIGKANKLLAKQLRKR